MVFSATRNTVTAAGLASTTYLVRQLIFVILGICLMTAVAFVDYRHYRELAPVLYLGCELARLCPLLGSRVPEGIGSFFPVVLAAVFLLPPAA